MTKNIETLHFKHTLSKVNQKNNDIFDLLKNEIKSHPAIIIPMRKDKSIIYDEATKPIHKHIIDLPIRTNINLPLLYTKIDNMFNTNPFEAIKLAKSMTVNPNYMKYLLTKHRLELLAYNVTYNKLIELLNPFDINFIRELYYKTYNFNSYSFVNADVAIIKND